MNFKFSPENKGGPLLIATILACMISGGLAPVATEPLTNVSSERILYGMLLTTVLGPLLALPGVALAYVILRGQKKLPSLSLCFISGAVIGSTVGFFYMPFWENIEWLRATAFATGPLAGLLYYFLKRKDGEMS
jgi:hypothetical protein